MEKYTYLSDIEKELIESFYKNEIQREAVRKVLLAGIYENGTLKEGQKAEPGRNFALALAFEPQWSDEQLGAELKARARGISMVETGFDELKKFEKLVVTKEEVNEAR